MLRAGHALALVTVALLMLGVVMVNSAGLTIESEQELTFKSLLLGRHAILAMMAICALGIGSILPVHHLSRMRAAYSPIPWIILGCVALLILVRIPGIGREVNGAWRWIYFGPINFQPSEVAKWGLVIVLAWYGARYSQRIGKLFTGLIPPLLLIGVICALIATEDLGTAVLIGLVGLGLLLAAGAKIWQVAMLIPIGLAGAVAAVIQSPYRLERLKAFVDPYQDPQGIGYHMIQSMAAVSQGGITGRGLGNGIHKFGYLPEDTTDFVFAIVCEELGVAGATIVVTFYVIFIFAALSIVRRAVLPFDRLLALGVLLTVGLQALINLAVVTGLAPTKGIALPLLSAGGTGWVLTAFTVGLLVAVDRRLTNDLPEIEVEYETERASWVDESDLPEVGELTLPTPQTA